MNKKIQTSHCSLFNIYYSRLGFTLIELLVVISIIGVLIALSFVGFNQARKSARDSKRRADLEQIRSALEIYRNDCKTYPAGLTFGQPLIGAGLCAGNQYMSMVPSDPSNYNYYYKYLSANSYVLCAYLETGDEISISDCGSNCGGVNCNYKVTNP